MGQYAGKICPYCRAELKDFDSIVICSKCGMPHHKECWIENQECTTFGCDGTMEDSRSGHYDAETQNNFDIDIEMSYDDFRSPNERCLKCGTVRPGGAMFCPYCGTGFSQSEQRTQSSYNSQYAYQHNQTPGFNQSEYDFVGSNGLYYSNAFQKIRMGNKKTSWNWCAFLFTAYWFAYRKMYGWAAGVILTNTVLIFIGGFASLFLIASFVLIGIFANYLYLQHIETALQQCQNLQEPFKTQEIKKKGGTSTLSVVLFAAYIGVLSSIIYI